MVLYGFNSRFEVHCDPFCHQKSEKIFLAAAGPLCDAFIIKSGVTCHRSELLTRLQESSIAKDMKIHQSAPDNQVQDPTSDKLVF